MLEMSLINKLCYLNVHSVSFYVQLALLPILPLFLDFILTPTGMDAWSLFTYRCLLTTFTSVLSSYFSAIFHYLPLSWSQTQPFCTCCWQRSYMTACCNSLVYVSSLSAVAELNAFCSVAAVTIMCLCLALDVPTFIPNLWCESCRLLKFVSWF